MPSELSPAASEYIAALSEYEFAKHRAMRVARFVVAVATRLRTPGQFLFRNASSGEPWEDMPKISDFDEADWPSGKDISTSLAAWQRAFHRVQETRKHLTTVEIAELPQPPTLIELRHSVIS